jgi:serine/threonine protein kinase
MLGKGSFGEVYKAHHIKGNFVCAIKMIKKASLRKNKLYFELMQNELKVLQETSHPQIMCIYELLEDSRHYYVISEFIRGGELFNRIVKIQSFTENKAGYLAYQILLALNYIH